MVQLTSVLCVAVVLLSAVPAHGADVEVDKQRPVSKVITLLKDMVGQLQKESEKDAKVYETFGCWCETGVKGKTVAISDAEQQIADLTSAIAGLGASSARLNTEIEKLNKEIAGQEEALESATAMRKKEMAEFQGEERSALSSIGAMKGAVDTLSTQHDAALLQGGASKLNDDAITAVMVTIKTQLRKHPNSVSGPQRRVIDAFLQAPEDFVGHDDRHRSGFLQQGHNPEYAPQSGAIFGVLKGMKENFEKNLESSQKEETQSQSDYEALKKAKTSQIAASTTLSETKTGLLADTDARLAESEGSKKDTEHILEADKSFLANLKEKCQTIDAEYHERVSTRSMEITAVSKALEYLTSDDAADLFSRTFKSFVQLRAVKSAEPVAGGEQEQAANKMEDAFGAVEESVEEMIKKLSDEKEEEIKLKDFCIDSLQKNERDTEDKNRDAADHKYKIGEQTNLIEKLAKEIEVQKEEIAKNRQALKRAGEDREMANRDFQLTVADQRATRKLLQGALSILEGFYKTSLAQTHAKAKTHAHVHQELKQPAGTPPPAGFEKQENTGASGGVMQMIKNIISDAQAMEEEALKGEEEAQIAYESFVAETNTAVVEAQKAIVKASDWKAQTESEKAQEQFEMTNVLAEIRDLGLTNVELHKQCDYTLKNFDDKQAARDAEIMGLRENVALIRGQKLAAAANAAH